MSASAGSGNLDACGNAQIAEGRSARTPAHGLDADPRGRDDCAGCAFGRHRRRFGKRRSFSPPWRPRRHDCLSTYAGLLGVRLPMAAVLTGDADIAHDYAISHEVEDSLPPMIELLQSVDPTFRPIPHRGGPTASSAFQTASGYRVEFLTSHRGSDNIRTAPLVCPPLAEQVPILAVSSTFLFVIRSGRSCYTRTASP